MKLDHIDDRWVQASPTGMHYERGWNAVFMVLSSKVLKVLGLRLQLNQRDIIFTSPKFVWQPAVQDGLRDFYLLYYGYFTPSASQPCSAACSLREKIISRIWKPNHWRQTYPVKSLKLSLLKMILYKIMHKVVCFASSESIGPNKFLFFVHLPTESKCFSFHVPYST